MKRHADGTLDWMRYSAPGWVAEIKYNGDRRILEVGDKEVQLYGRKPGVSGKPRSVHEHAIAAGVLPEWETLKQFNGLKLDGELCLPGKGTTHVNVTELVGGSVSSMMENPNYKELVYVVFDIVDDKSRSLAFKQRRQLMRRIVEKLREYGFGFYVSQQVSDPLGYEEFYDSALAEGHEGIILKQQGYGYIEGDNRSWIKVKPVYTTVAYVRSLENGNGSNLNRVASIDFITQEGYEGSCSGFTDEVRDAMEEDRLYYIRKPFELEYSGITRDGNLENPRFSGWRFTAIRGL